MTFKRLCVREGKVCFYGSYFHGTRLRLLQATRTKHPPYPPAWRKFHPHEKMNTFAELKALRRLIRTSARITAFGMIRISLFWCLQQGFRWLWDRPPPPWLSATGTVIRTVPKIHVFPRNFRQNTWFLMSFLHHLTFSNSKLFSSRLSRHLTLLPLPLPWRAGSGRPAMSNSLSHVCL